MMSKSDLDKIKIGTESFTSKWWTKKRAIQAHGSGVGKALDAWNKACPDDPTSVREAKAVKAARDAAEDLKAAFGKAKTKCGRLATETAAACDRYIKLIDGYIAQLASQDEDEAVWKQILVEMPKAIGAMAKLEKELDQTLTEFAELDDNLKMLEQRAEMRNRMPLHGGRDDLRGAMKEFGLVVRRLEKAAGEASGGMMLGSTVIDLEKKLKGTDHAKDMRAFRDKIARMNELDEKVRDVMGPVLMRYRKVNDLVEKVEQTVEKARREFSNYQTMFWEAPASGLKVVEPLMVELTEAAERRIKAGKPQDEAGRRDLRDYLNDTDNELLQLTASLGNLTRNVKTVGELARTYPKDKTITEGVREMALGLQLATKRREALLKEVNTLKAFLST